MWKAAQIVAKAPPALSNLQEAQNEIVRKQGISLNAHVWHQLEFLNVLLDQLLAKYASHVIFEEGSGPGNWDWQKIYWQGAGRSKM